MTVSYSHPKIVGYWVNLYIRVTELLETELPSVVPRQLRRGLAAEDHLERVSLAQAVTVTNPIRTRLSES